MTKRIPPYLLHILGCTLFLSIPVFASPDFDDDVNLFEVAPFLRDFFGYTLLVIFFYANYLYLVPKFFFTGRKTAYYLIIAGCFLVITLLPFVIAMAGAAPAPPPVHPMGEPHHRHHHGPDIRFFIEASGIFQFLLIFFLSFLVRVNLRLTDIQNEKLKTELSYLKAQINPHFLFNTLNSLYSLALTQSGDTPSAILKLSSIMRYVVTESSREYVAMDKEIEYIRNYIALQELRMDDSTAFSFDVAGESAGKMIAPLLLIPFIENAFKYGLNPEEESAIVIQISFNEDKVMLFVANKKAAVVVPEEERTGQGMENALKRLEYLYKGKYDLRITDSPNDYEVTLIISL